MAMVERLRWTSKSGTLSVNFRGKSVEEAIQNAAIKAVDETNDEAVRIAQSLVRVDTGRLKGSIRSRKAEVGKRGAVNGGFGSYGVEYAIYQEIGPVTGVRYWAFTPYLRPARDATYPKLAQKIKVILQ